MLQAHDVASRHLASNAKRSKERYDVNISYHNYEIGDVVWFLHETRKIGTAPKLEQKYDGPYIVKWRRSAVNFLVQLDDAGTEKLVHHDKLKPYAGSTLPAWVTRARKKLLPKIE